MGLRCTLFGHTYGDSEIEREREERGDEAVVTIQEIQRCERCGHESVVSENKEVSSIAEPSVDAAPASEPDPAPIGDEGGVDAATGPEHDPETDDGVILDDGADEADDEPPEERQYGEWPDADEDHASADADPVAAGEDSAPAEWPDAEGDDEGIDASTPADEDVDADASGLADAAMTGGEREADESAAGDAPASGSGQADADADAADDASGPSVAEGEDVEFLDVDDASEATDASANRAGRGAGSAESGRDAGMQSDGEAPSPAQPSTAGTELHCPACGYRDDSTDGSLREGDICPECKKGYLAASE